MPRSARPTKFRNKWRIRWLDHEGVRRSAVFETYEEADRELRRELREVDEIRLGLKRAVRGDRAFDDLADYWLENRAPEKRSRADDESIIRRHLRPAFGKMKLGEIGTRALDEYKASKSKLSPKTVANHLTLLGTMLQLAVELEWLANAPRIRKPRIDPDDEVEHAWLKSADQIARFLDAAKAEIDPEDPFTEIPFVLYSTAIYTGLRAGELAGLRWSDVDLDRQSIDVRRSCDGKTKTRSSRRYVPIVYVLLPTLKRWKLRCPKGEEGLVFPNRKGKMRDGSSRIFQETLHRVLDRAGFERPASSRSVHVIHFHSLRHTFACH